MTTQANERRQLAPGPTKPPTRRGAQRPGATSAPYRRAGGKEPSAVAREAKVAGTLTGALICALTCPSLDNFLYFSKLPSEVNRRCSMSRVEFASLPLPTAVHHSCGTDSRATESPGTRPEQPCAASKWDRNFGPTAARRLRGRRRLTNHNPAAHLAPPTFPTGRQSGPARAERCGVVRAGRIPGLHPSLSSLSRPVARTRGLGG